MKRTRRPRPPVTMPSAFTGFRFPPEVILLAAVRWYLRYGTFWPVDNAGGRTSVQVGVDDRKVGQCPST
jgi:hypothetical protein